MNSPIIITGLIAITASLASSQYYEQPRYGGGNPYQNNPYNNYNGGYQGNPYQQHPYGGGNPYGGNHYGNNNYGGGGNNYGGYHNNQPPYNQNNYGGTKQCANPWKCCRARRNKNPYAQQICEGCGNNVCNVNDPNHWSRVKPTNKPTTPKFDSTWRSDGWNSGNSWNSGQSSSQWGSSGSCCQTLDGCPNSFPVRTDTLVLSERNDQTIRLKVCCKETRDTWRGDPWGEDSFKSNSWSGNRSGGDSWNKGGGFGRRYEPTAYPTVSPTVSPTESPTFSPTDDRRRLSEGERELMNGGAYGYGSHYQGQSYSSNGGYYGPYQESYYQQPYNGGHSYGGGNSYGGGQDYHTKSYEASNPVYSENSYGGGGDYNDSGSIYGGSSYGSGHSNNYGEDSKSVYSDKSYGGDYGGSGAGYADKYDSSGYGDDEYGDDDYGTDDYGTDDYGTDDYGTDDYDKSNVRYSYKPSYNILESCPSRYEPTMQPTVSPTYSPSKSPTESPTFSPTETD